MDKITKKQAQSEQQKKETKQDTAPSRRFDLSKYHKHMIVAGLIAAFVFGMVFANFFNTMVLDKVSAQNQNTVSALQTEKELLRTEKEDAISDYETAKRQLELYKEKYDDDTQELQNEITAMASLIDSLGSQGSEVRTEYKQYYEIEWDKYISAKAGDEVSTQVKVENTGTGEKTYEKEILHPAR